MNIRNVIATICFFAGTGIITFLVMIAWANTPEVYQAGFDRTCIAIWTPTHGLTDCNSQPMPSKYETTLVMQGTTFADVAHYQ